MDNQMYAFAVVAVIALVTALLRFFPFLVFNDKGSVPKVIRYLGGLLPYSIMGMLVVYCLKDTSFATISGWLPTLIATAAVVIVHVWKRNTLVSIIVGTACYMLLIRFAL